jgi:hypothetical protein
LEFVPKLILSIEKYFVLIICLPPAHVHGDQELRTIYQQSSLELETK